MIQGSEHTLDFWAHSVGAQQTLSMREWLVLCEKRVCILIHPVSSKGRGTGCRAKCNKCLKWFNNSSLFFLAIYSLGKFSVMLSHNNSQEAHELARRYFTEVGRWSFKIVKEQMDGIELGLEVVAGPEFESPPVLLWHTYWLSRPWHI